MWIEMLCLMWQADPRGSLLVNGRQVTPRQLAPLVGAAPREVETLFAELEETGVFSRDNDGTVFSRRMRKDVEKARADQVNGKGGGNPRLTRGVNPPPNPPDKGVDKAQKPEARSQMPDAASAAGGGTGMTSFELECRRSVEPEPVMLAQDFHVITALLDEGVIEADVRTGIAEALERRSDPRKRYRSWGSIANWCRTAAQNRLADGPRAAPDPLNVAAKDATGDPRVEFGGGVSAPVSTIRSVRARGAWLPDWGPKPGEPGCRVPAHLLEMAAT